MLIAVKVILAMLMHLMLGEKIMHLLYRNRIHYSYRKYECEQSFEERGAFHCPANIV